MKRTPAGRIIGLFFGSFVILSLAAHPALAGDWIHWRGPSQDGVATDGDLPDTFGTDPTDPKSNLIWKAPYGCRSTPLVMNGKVYIINSDGDGQNEGERVMAFDANTGKVLWEHKFNVFHTDIVSSRVGWACLAGDPETGRIYAHGVQGLFWCLDGATGKPVWSHSLTEEFGRVSGYGGRVVSPIVDGDLVIVGMINGSWGDFARGNNRFMAFDKKTGAVRWWSSPTEFNKLTYNSIPIVAVIGGQRLLITGTADGALTAMQVNTGKKVWSYMFGASAINSSPVTDGKYVYITHGQENLDQGVQGRIICVDATQIENGKPKLVWEELGTKCDLASPILHDGRLYVPDDGATLHCLDAKTGKRLWKFKYGRVARAAPVWADGKIWVAEVNSKFHVLKPGDKRCTELAEVPFFSGKGVSIESSGSAAVANGRIYFGTESDIYCVGKKNRREAATEDRLVEAQAKRPEVESTPEAAFALVVPGEAAIHPGESIQYTVRLYDANGEYLGEADSAEWSLPLPPKAPTGAQPPALAGSIERGKLTVNKMPAGQQGYVEAKVGRLSARARVRVAPALPYTMDLSKTPVGSTPGGWINVQGKYVVEEKDGKKILKKLAVIPSPPVARANAYIALPESGSYTIQADATGTLANNNMPDFGVVNARYTLQVAGNKQELRLLSWEATSRIDKTIDYAWKPGEWVTMKLVVEDRGKTAMVRGKVWPKGQPEPAAWTIEVEDPRPNRSGSPALYAYATGIFPPKHGAEAFFDNVKVTPNK